MATVLFNFKGVETIIQCNINDKMKSICDKFISKIENNYKKIYFIYNGDSINMDLTFSQQASKSDLNQNRMVLLVYEKDEKIKENTKILSKEIICPECGENSEIKLKDYKICLYNCKNGHKIENILMNKFEETQMIDLSKIVCAICKEKNKYNTYKNEFYRCLSCSNNLCPLCKSMHDKTHNIINYEQKNYICEIHNDSFIKYCKTCNKNMCISCENDHIKHEIIYLGDIMYSKDDVLQLKEGYKKMIEASYKKIDEIINTLNCVKSTIEVYYEIINRIINSYQNKNRNYQILQNLEELLGNDIIGRDIYGISTYVNINNNFDKLLKIYYKIINKKNDITIKYKINKNDKFIKIFDEYFVNNNRNVCKIKYNNDILELREKFNIENINNDILEIKLIGFIYVTDMRMMFNGCKSLLSISGNDEWDSSNVIEISRIFDDCISLESLPNIFKSINKVDDISYIFSGCSSLTSLPDISKWDTSKVKTMRSIFKGCSSLTSLPDISNWNTSNVEEMDYIFENCSSLTKLPDISKWDTSKVKTMYNMFNECSSLTSLPDISKWDTSKVESMTYMFRKCKSLTKLPDITKWNTDEIRFCFGMLDECNPSIKEYYLNYFIKTKKN